MTIRQQTADDCAFCQRMTAAGATYYPMHDPSPRCQSGSYPHCTCDVCF